MRKESDPVVPGPADSDVKGSANILSRNKNNNNNNNVPRNNNNDGVMKILLSHPPKTYISLDQVRLAVCCAAREGGQVRGK